MQRFFIFFIENFCAAVILNLTINPIPFIEVKRFFIYAAGYLNIASSPYNCILTDFTV
ncbi:hypothetical protein TPE_0299 [Treponema pedis str. T A4]|uniref:Uncharacterized protein n=1 Tax=Treponema pedis str. T A4 TaxID=1291379 RepID=S5ZRW7_9SPIR|nr:hypothetical protein TPE_0299 [Treponema pedis str. T A4]